MSVIDVLANTVQTMTTIEENTDALIKAIEILTTEHNKLSENAKCLEEAYMITHACLDVLTTKVLEYIKAERKLILEYKKSCRANVMDILEDYE